MSTTTTSSETRAMGEILSENNVQGFVAKNKTAVITALVLIVVLMVGFGLFKTFADKSHTEYNSKIYAFETTTLKDYVASPVKPKDLEQAVASLHLEMGNYIGLLPVVIKSSDALVSHSHFAEARAVLSIGEKVANDDYARYFIYSRQAAVYEDLGETKLAIETLEKMTSQSVKIFEGKAYLDLGRLYLKEGNKEKAKASFQYVVEKAKDEVEFVKLAQLYLAGL
jgi:predicted negative regulator of RcsB-dependent stress response